MANNDFINNISNNSNNFGIGKSYFIKKDQEKPQKTFTETISGVKAAIQRGILALGNLPDKAYFSLNACVKTLKRVFSTKNIYLNG